MDAILAIILFICLVYLIVVFEVNKASERANKKRCRAMVEAAGVNLERDIELMKTSTKYYAELKLKDGVKADG